MGLHTRTHPAIGLSAGACWDALTCGFNCRPERIVAAIAAPSAAGLSSSVFKASRTSFAPTDHAGYAAFTPTTTFLMPTFGFAARMLPTTTSSSSAVMCAVVSAELAALGAFSGVAGAVVSPMHD